MGLLTDLFRPSDRDRAMRHAWLHHLHALQSTDKPLDATRYLYERLNIVDRKADMILRLNLLILTFLAFMASLFLREVVAAAQSGVANPLLQEIYTTKVAIAVLLLFSCVAISSVLTYSIGALRLDYVTTRPSVLANTRIAWSGEDAGTTATTQTDKTQPAAVPPDPEQLAKNTPNPNERRWWATYASDDWRRVLAAIDRPTGAAHSAYDFDRAFLRTIIARQGMLSVARFLSGLALLAYFFVLLQVLRASCILAAWAPFRLGACPS